MNTTLIGRKAEEAAKVYLEMRGFTVLEQNFRRPRCELDMVARKNDTLYFVEVKYRASDDNGSGFEAITFSKLRQMVFAAEIYVQETKWSGSYELAAVELSGPDFTVIGFIDSIDA